MDFIFFIPFWVIIAIILFVIAGVHMLVNSLVDLLVYILIFVIFMCALYIIFKGLLDTKKKRSFFYGLIEVLKGCNVIVLLVLIDCFVEIGCGLKSFQNASFVFFGNLSMFDKRIFICVVTLLLCLVISLPKKFIIKRSKKLYYFFTLLLIIIIDYGVCKFGLSSEYLNSKDFINANHLDFKVTENTNLYHFVNLVFDDYMIATDCVEKDTELQAYHVENEYIDPIKSIKFNGKEYYYVANGKNIGYISEDTVEKMYTYIYLLKCETDVYGVEEESRKLYFSGDYTTVFTPNKKVVTTLQQGYEISVIGTYPMQDDVYLLIELSDGDKGFIISDYVEKKIIRKD